MRVDLDLIVILILSAPSLPSSSPGLPTPSRGGSKSSWWGFPVSPSFSYFPQPGGIAAQWVGCLPLPQPHLHRDNTVWLVGCRQGFLIAEFSKFQINPKPSNVQFLYFIGVRLYPTPSGKQLDRVFDADRDGAGNGHLLPGWGGSGETLFHSLLIRLGCLSTPIL